MKVDKNMVFHRLQSYIPYAANSYLIMDGKDWAVVDPTVPYDTVLTQYPEMPHRLKYVLLTHAHFDHMLTIDEWALHAEEVIVGAWDVAALSNPDYNCYRLFLDEEAGYEGDYTPVSDGDILPLGEGSIHVIGCPGHTKGSMTYRIENHAFSGDTIFSHGGMGRCDLPGGNDRALRQTIARLIDTTPDTIFHPGHGPDVPYEELKRCFG